MPVLPVKQRSSSDKAKIRQLEAKVKTLQDSNSTLRTKVRDFTRCTKLLKKLVSGLNKRNEKVIFDLTGITSKATVGSQTRKTKLDVIDPLYQCSNVAIPLGDR